MKSLNLASILASIVYIYSCSFKGWSKLVKKDFHRWVSTDYNIPANFFWDVGVRFLSWECWDFWKRHNHFRRRPKSAKDIRSLPKAKLLRKRLSTKSEMARKVLSFIHFTRGFRSLHGSELTYFWKLCQARRQQLTFFNQAWEIGPQAWAGLRSKFSTRRRETHA